VITRKPMDMDVPALSCVRAKDAADPKGPALMLMSRTKYGYRCYNNRLSLDLLRSACHPEPYLEIGASQIAFAIMPVRESDNMGMLRLSQIYNAPLFTASNPCDRNAAPAIPTCGGFLRDVCGCVILSVKRAEDSEDIVIRFCEPEGNETEASVTFTLPVKRAYWVDGNERTVDRPVEFEGGRIAFTLGAFQSGALRVGFSY